MATWFDFDWPRQVLLWPAGPSTLRLSSSRQLCPQIEPMFPQLPEYKFTASDESMPPCSNHAYTNAISRHLPTFSLPTPYQSRNSAETLKTSLPMLWAGAVQRGDAVFCFLSFLCYKAVQPHSPDRLEASAAPGYGYPGTSH